MLGRDANAITATDERGVVHIPSASLGVLLLGPGTNLTHQAMWLLADSGATAVWVGEQGVRCYASGRSLASSSRLVEAQARLVSNRQSRLAVARQMYQMRFEGEDTSRLTMQQLRGREGARVRAAYRESAATYGVEWKRRDYKPDQFDASDSINQALSAANACLYGVVHAVVVSLGCSAGLGFVHSGHELSFVYDIADLYKAEYSIPIAFQCVAELEGDGALGDDLGPLVRHRMRDSLSAGHLLERCVRDIRSLLLPEDTEPEGFGNAEVLELWDERVGRVAGGSNYGDSPPYDEVDF